MKFTLGSILALLVLIVAVLGAIGLGIPAQAMWICIAVLALAILVGGFSATA